ncbi:MAG: decarboxylating 6-phosphogluconate dehydrogenase [Candidatus Wildermuthbacteria bacterium]|nr:decarboxylating 6-phosphogluconate dehydrogenase [Candidatus Wildermuthbacteria bacterium]
MHKQIGFIGLGKMGMPMSQRLREKGWDVVGFDIDLKVSEVSSIKELVEKLFPPRIVFLMLPSGKPVETAVAEMALLLQKGDIVIDGGNSFYKDSLARARNLEQKGVVFLDAGISGGPVSIGMGKFAIMVGGKEDAYARAKEVFDDLSDTSSVYMGSSGSGHFTKMIHNGIEYGMMQSLAEGFTILKHSPFGISLEKAARAYGSNSIISSRLVDWLLQGFEQYGEDLEQVSGTVAHTGEGEWTVKTAQELGVDAPVIKEAFLFRVESAKKQSYAGKILSMLRSVFGGHSIR